MTPGSVVTSDHQQGYHQDCNHCESDDPQCLNPPWHPGWCALLRAVGIRVCGVGHGSSSDRRKAPILIETHRPCQDGLSYITPYCTLRIMPKLWDETIEAHRRAVRDATLDTTAALVAERGMRAVTMSEIAEKTGIGRATLYKYFPDVETILAAWHQRQISQHLDHLADVRDRTTGEDRRLEAVLEAYALIQRERAQHQHQPHGAELAAFLHRDQEVAQAQRQLHHLIQDLIAEAAAAGTVRQDVAPAELAGYCIHALAAARHAPSNNAVRRLVNVTSDGLRP